MTSFRSVFHGYLLLCVVCQALIFFVSLCRLAGVFIGFDVLVTTLNKHMLFIFV